MINRRASTPVRAISAAARWILCAVMLLGGTAANAKKVTLEFEIDGQPRSAIAYVPKGSELAGSETAKRALIIVYHGRGDDSAAFASAVQLHRDWPQAIVVYPRGEKIDTRPAMRGWQYRTGTYDNRDLKLTDRLLAELNQRYAIDAEATFAAGFSNGAHFVFLLMKERPERFRAFAAIGAIQPDFESSASPRPLLYLFGRNEPAEYADDWEKTVKALARFTRSGASDEAYLGCCRLLGAGENGVEFAYGAYSAGHIWPYDGNRWIREFFERIEQQGTHASGELLD